MAIDEQLGSFTVAFLNLATALRGSSPLFGFGQSFPTVFISGSDGRNKVVFEDVKGTKGLLIADRVRGFGSETCHLCKSPTHYSRYYLRKEGGLFVVRYYHCCDVSYRRHYLISGQHSLRVLDMNISNDFVQKVTQQITGYLKELPLEKSQQFLDLLAVTKDHFSQHS